MEIETSEMIVERIEKQPQRQDSLVSQVMDLIEVAERLGMYDAADYLKEKFYNK